MIYRTYECIDCKTVFEVSHPSGDDPFPDCPTCSKVLEWRPQRFATKTNVSYAADVTQKILETDYGLTDFNDNSRAGDIAYKAAPETQEQRDARKVLEDTAKMMQEQARHQAASPTVKGFWGGAQGAPPAQIIQSALAGAKQGPKGIDPIKSLHDMGRAGKLPSNFSIIARG